MYNLEYYFFILFNKFIFVNLYYKIIFINKFIKYNIINNPCWILNIIITPC